MCLQASWCTLRAEFVHLNPAQLHHMLREYNTARMCPPCWTPSPEDSAAALNTCEPKYEHTHTSFCNWIIQFPIFNHCHFQNLLYQQPSWCKAPFLILNIQWCEWLFYLFYKIRLKWCLECFSLAHWDSLFLCLSVWQQKCFLLANILESFDNHPPLILPSSIFNLELGNPITEPGLFTPLRHLQEFIQSLPDSQTQSDHQPSQVNLLHAVNSLQTPQKMQWFKTGLTVDFGMLACSLEISNFQLKSV